jgi:aryl-alcohol dehydrogenase-like predicted oxidoreductase
VCWFGEDGCSAVWKPSKARAAPSVRFERVKLTAVIERQSFGRTGHDSSRVIFGGAALGSMSQERADRLLPLLQRFGVNHLDVAASYGDAELRVAPWMQARRSEFFLATKTGDRTGDEARASLERSLERMGVDYVDLIQLHNLVEEDEWAVAHGSGGAVEALVRAREEGLARFIGVTGHGTRIAAMHRRSLERFDFDSVLLPYNFLLLQDSDYRAELEALLAECAERRVAVQTIKSVARRRWSTDAGPRYSWYEPVSESAALERAVRYVLARPAVFLNTSSDARLLQLILEAAESCARRPDSPSDAQMQADVDALGMKPLFDGHDLERI